VPPRRGPETHPFFGTRARCRKLIRYRGVAPGAMTDEKSLFGVWRKSNDFRTLSFADSHNSCSRISDSLKPAVSAHELLTGPVRDSLILGPNCDSLHNGVR
jgi:hypothetical protein